MLKTLLSFVALTIVSMAHAQTGNVVLFSEAGENFTAYLNSVKQNDAPVNNLKVENLNQEFYQLRIDFEDPTLQDFTSNLGVEFGMEWTHVIKIGRKGTYVVRPFSSAPVGSVSTPAVVQEVKPAPTIVQPTPTRVEVVEEEVVVVETPVAPATTTVTTTTVKTSDPEKIDVKMTVPGVDMRVEMTVPNVEMEMTETYTTTTTTSTTRVEPQEPQKLTRPAQPVEEVREPAIPGYSGPVGCNWPNSDSDFNQLKNSINAKTFEDSKLSTAKQALKNKCLKAEQVKELMLLFTFEESRLDIAKFAYDYTYDQGNYYLINDAFTFEFSIDELNEYLEGR